MVGYLSPPPQTHTHVYKWNHMAFLTNIGSNSSYSSSVKDSLRQQTMANWRRAAIVFSSFMYIDGNSRWHQRTSSEILSFRPGSTGLLQKTEVSAVYVICCSWFTHSLSIMYMYLTQNGKSQMFSRPVQGREIWKYCSSPFIVIIPCQKMLHWLKIISVLHDWIDRLISAYHPRTT